MTQERKALTAWGDDVALRGPNAPRNDGSIKHMIEYLLTVYERFGNTTITANLQWGASALWKRDEAQKRVAELQAELEAIRSAKPEELSAERNDLIERCAALECQLAAANERLDDWRAAYSALTLAAAKSPTAPQMVPVVEGVPFTLNGGERVVMNELGIFPASYTNPETGESAATGANTAPTGLKLPIRVEWDGQNYYVDADGKSVATSELVAALNAFALSPHASVEAHGNCRDERCRINGCQSLTPGCFLSREPQLGDRKP